MNRRNKAKAIAKTAAIMIAMYIGQVRSILKEKV